MALLGSVVRAEPAIFAHRGARGWGPDNSLLAFQMARKAGATGIELDVRMTKDGHVVVFHDAKAVLPSGKAVKISKLTLAQMRTLDLGMGQRVPTLEEAIRAIGPTMRLVVEIKGESPRPTGIERKVVDIVLRQGAIDRVLISSFNPLALERVKRLEPRIDIGVWIVGDRTTRLALWAFKPAVVHPPSSKVNHASLARWRKQGLRVLPSVVNDPDTMRRLATLGVDAILTDRPDVAVETLGQQRRHPPRTHLPRISAPIRRALRRPASTRTVHEHRAGPRVRNRPPRR